MGGDVPCLPRVQGAIAPSFGALSNVGERTDIFPIQFVEDEGDVVFYKNARGLAKMRPVFNDAGASDSGIEITEKRAS